MTIIYVAENNCQCLVVTFKNKGKVRIQKLEDISEDKKIIYEVNPMETFIGKSEDCEMTSFSGARNKKVFDGNTILKVSEENNRHRYVFIGGEQVCSFLTNDRIYKYISNIGSNLSPCSIAIGYENIFYLTPFFKFTRKEIIDVDDIDKLFDIDYDDIINREELKINKIHSSYDKIFFI